MADPRSAVELANLTALARVASKRLEQVIRCDGTPRRCRLSGIESHLSFTAPKVSGDTATVDMLAEVNVNAPNAVHSLNSFLIRYTLVRSVAGWQVAKTQILGET